MRGRLTSHKDQQQHGQWNCSGMTFVPRKNTLSADLKITDDGQVT